MIRTLIVGFGVICFSFTVLQYSVLLVYALLSGRLLRDNRAGRRPVALAKIATDRTMPGVSIVMPAYNEENVITHTTVSALAQEYPRVEVIVVNDGSKDATLQVLIDHFHLEPYDTDPPPGPIPTEPVKAIYRSRSESRIVVVDKAPSGAKADGSNAGINAASYPWVVVMDADEFMERDTIARCMVEVVAAPDTTAMVGGTLLPTNDIVIEGPNIIERHTPRNYWVGCQLIEYLTAFLVARPGLARLRAMPIVSGGFGLFRRDAVVAVGGYRHGHLGEDMDMCLRVQRDLADRGEKCRVVQVPESLCWTEFPQTKDVLRRQRIRWHRGLRMIMRDHGSMIGRRRYGPVGHHRRRLALRVRMARTDPRGSGLGNDVRPVVERLDRPGCGVRSVSHDAADRHGAHDAERGGDDEVPANLQSALRPRAHVRVGHRTELGLPPTHSRVADPVLVSRRLGLGRDAPRGLQDQRDPSHLNQLRLARRYGVAVTTR